MGLRADRLWGATAALCMAAASAMLAGEAQAAGGAYQVDTAEVSEPGSCKVEAWVSSANNSDFIAATTPSCVVNLFRAVEVSAQISRSRADDEWGTGVAPKLKTNLIPSSLGTWGLAITTSAGYDPLAQDLTVFNVTLPATFRVSSAVRLNVNAGYQRDRLSNRDYLTYGAGFDWRTPDNVWTLTGEMFGQAGARPEDESRSLTQPRWQLGLRYRPIDIWNIDLIYGRNITGENAHWLTLATIIRFKPAEK